MDVVHTHALKLARRALDEHQQPEEPHTSHGVAGYIVVFAVSLFFLTLYGLVCSFLSRSGRGRVFSPIWTAC